MISGASSPRVSLARTSLRPCAKKLGKGALDHPQSHPFCKKETLGS